MTTDVRLVTRIVSGGRRLSDYPLDGTPLKEGTPVAALIIPGEEAKLKLHPDHEREQRAMGATA